MSGAGEGIESTSVLLSLYKWIEGALSNILHKNGEDAGSPKETEAEFNKEVVYVPASSSIWNNLMNNATVNVRVVITREGGTYDTFQSALKQLM